jgi:ribonuclease P protein component
MFDSLKEEEIKEIFEKGRRQRNFLFSIAFSARTNEEKRFGVIVGKKTGLNAVKRNKVKRRFRHLIREEKKIINSRNIFVVIANAKAYKADTITLKRNFLDAAKKAELL